MIVVGCDHAGLKLKQKLTKHFQKKGISFFDVGADSFEPLDSYVDYAKKAIDYYIANCNLDADKLVLICGSGIGMDITANRNTKIRSVLALSTKQAVQGRMHNNANCLCLGCRNTNYICAKHIVGKFLKTEFLGGKYQKRLETI